MVPVEAVLLLLAQVVLLLAVEARQQEEVVEEAELNQPRSFVTGNHPSHHPLHTA